MRALLLSKFLTSCCPQLSVPEHPLPSTLPDPKSKALQETWQEPFWATACPIARVTACLGVRSYKEHIYPTMPEQSRHSPSITEGLILQVISVLRLQAAALHTVTDRLKTTKVQKHGRKWIKIAPAGPWREEKEIVTITTTCIELGMLTSFRSAAPLDWTHRTPRSRRKASAPFLLQ